MDLNGSLNNLVVGSARLAPNTGSETLDYVAHIPATLLNIVVGFFQTVI